jgi:Tol biopolymer transport system component
VERISAQGSIRFEPNLEGEMAWIGNVAYFWPSQPLEAGQVVKVIIAPGIQAVDGRMVRNAVEWQVRVRESGLVYLAPSREPELWFSDLSDADPVQLTDTGGRVFDFGVSPDGERVAFSRFDDQGGISLWAVDRTGSAKILLDCGEDVCINPDFSPDGSHLAYARRNAGISEGSSPGIPRLWIMNLESGETEALYANPNISGSEPSWSPDGSRIAFYDGLSQGLRLTQLDTREDILLPSEMGMTLEWTPDGTALYFSNIILEESRGYEVVFRYALTSGELTRGLGEDALPLDYGPVAIHPQGDWLVVGIREASGNPARMLWLMRSDGSERQAVTSDPLINVGAYRWSPNGDQVAYQALELGSSSAQPFVMVWSRTAGESRVLAENASRPQWIP